MIANMTGLSIKLPIKLLVSRVLKTTTRRLAIGLFAFVSLFLITGAQQLTSPSDGRVLLVGYIAIVIGGLIFLYMFGSKKTWAVTVALAAAVFLPFGPLRALQFAFPPIAHSLGQAVTLVLKLALTPLYVFFPLLLAYGIAALPMLLMSLLLSLLLLWSAGLCIEKAWSCRLQLVERCRDK